MQLFSLLALLTFGLVVVSASHYRYGTISWTSDYNTNVNFTLETAWRRSYFNPLPTVGSTVSFGTFNFGDGKSNAALTATVTTINTIEDWFICITQFPHSYPSSNNSGAPWVAVFTGNARINTLQNNAGQNWYLMTTVNTGVGNSPVSKMLPIANVLYVQDYMVSFQIPSVSDNNAQVHYSLGTSTQICGTSGCYNPKNLAVDPVTGIVSWNLQGMPTGLWCAVVIISTDFVYVPVDFILNLQVVSGSCSSNCTKSGVTCTTSTDCGQCPNTNDPCVKPLPPVFVEPTPEDNTTIPASAGVAMSFNVSAISPQSASSVTIQESTLPAGATFGPNQGTNPVTRVFSWTPTAAQVGDYIVCFSATDNVGFASSQYCLTVEVSVGCTPACSGNSQCAGGSCICLPGYSGADCSTFGGLIPDGQALYGSVAMHASNYYSFTIGSNQNAIKIVLETIESNLDTALFVSTSVQQPDITHKTWDEIAENPNTIVIAPSDPNFVVGTYYLAVFGWYTGLNPVVDYNLTVFYS